MPNPAQGYVLSCGGEVVGNIYNGKNADGTLPGDSEPSCSLAPSATSGFAFSLNCGGTVVNIPASSSGGGGGGGGNCSATQPDEYNKFWLVMNCGSTINVCLNGGAFDPSTSICTNGLKRAVDINRVAYNYGSYYSELTDGSSATFDATTSGLPSDPNWADGSTYLSGSSQVTAVSYLPLRPGIVLSRSLFTCHSTAGNVSSNPDLITANQYDPNVSFCQPKTNGVSGAYELKPLCGGNDYTNSQFCFKGKPNAAGKQKEKVVNKCGGGATPSSGSEFTYKEFCQVNEVYTRKGSSLSGTTGYPSVSVAYTAYANGKKADLCGGESVWWDAVDTYTSANEALAAGRTAAAVGEISTANDGVWNTTTGASNTSIERGIMLAQTISTSGTVGSTEIPGIANTTGANKNFKGFDKASEGPIRYGKRTCEANVIMTQCALPSNTNTALPEGTVALLYNARTHFCRVNTKYNGTTVKQMVEIVPLCYSTDISPTTGRPLGGTEFDGVDYGCDLRDGQPAKKCGEEFYKDESEFCFKEGATPIAVGQKCRIYPLATGDNIQEYLPAQYDPRKQFCTLKIKAITGQSASSTECTAGFVLGSSSSVTGLNKLVYLNGSATQGGGGVGGGVGSSVWSLGVPTLLYTPYATNGFPACYDVGDMNSDETAAGTYAYEEVPEDMCQGKIKYNQGNWLWQSCLVTDKTDRTKDLYQHCGEGEMPKVDFTGCVKVAPRTVPSSSSGTSSSSSAPALTCGTGAGQALSACLTTGTCTTAGGKWNKITGFTGAPKCVATCPTNATDVSDECTACPAGTFPNVIDNTTTPECVADPGANKVFTSLSDKTQIWEDVTEAENGSAAAGDKYCITKVSGKPNYCSSVGTCVATDTGVTPPVSGTCGL